MGAVVVEGLMRAGGVVVRDVTAQQASEMPFVDHEDVIEAFPSNRPDDALGEGILPGRSRGNEDLAHPQAFRPPSEHVAVDGVPIAEQVLGRCLVREALDKLLGGPGGGWVIGDVEVDEFSTVVSKHQESEEQVKGEGRDDEEVILIAVEANANHYWQSTSTFLEARRGMVQAAEAIFGVNWPGVIEIKNAWDAVQVFDPPLPSP